MIVWSHFFSSMSSPLLNLPLRYPAVLPQGHSLDYNSNDENIYKTIP